MKLKIGWFIIVVLFISLGIYVYNFFNGGNNVREHLNREFVLKVGDIAHINEEVYIKLVEVKDERCKEDDCEREGQKVAKLVTIKNPYIRVVEIGSLTQEEIVIKRSDYKLKLITISEDDEVTLKVVGKEKK